MKDYSHPHDTSATLENEIGQTRHRMDETLDRLVDRLQPRHLLNDILDFWQARRERRGNGPGVASTVQENAQRAGRAVARQVRENPIPACLIGAGVAWLIFDRTRDHGHDNHEGSSAQEGFDEGYGTGAYGEATPGPGATASSGSEVGSPEAGAQPGTATAEMRERMRNRGRALKEGARARGREFRARAGDMGRQMQSRLREGYDRTQQRLHDGYERTQEKLHETAEAHPLATGAACLGLGLLAGFLLPKTRREQEWFGDTAHSVRQRVTEAGHDLVERGSHVAKAAVEAAKSEAEQQGLTPDHLKQGVTAVGQEAREAAQRTAEQEGIVPESLKQKTPDTATRGSKPDEESTPPYGAS